MRNGASHSQPKASRDAASAGVAAARARGISAVLCTLFALASSLSSAACAFRPARFADAPPVAEVADDDPIPLPPRLEIMDVVEFSDLIVWRPVIEGMRVRRDPPPGDINALDEVPKSSWFAPVPVAPDAFAEAYMSDGPPVPPYRVVLERAPTGSGGLPIMDALGRRYELRRDPSDRREVRTAAAAVSSRLVRALGYYAPEVYVSDAIDSDFTVAPPKLSAQAILSGFEPATDDAYESAAAKSLRDFLDAAPTDKHERHRFAAVRWPGGIDVGRTPALGTRGDDPNDRVDHESRRTLRALKIIASWLGMTRFTPHDLRDVYVGAPGAGHVRHFVVGHDKALGTESIIGRKPEQRDEVTLLVTLGFAPDPTLTATQRKYPALGHIDDDARPGEYRPGLPFPPMDHLDAADAYWIAKRIAAIPRETIALAVEAGQITSREARKRLIEIIEGRRARIVAWALEAVTPCEIVRVEPDRLVLENLAVKLGLTDPSLPRYSVSYFTSTGSEAYSSRVIAPEHQVFEVPLPAQVFREDGYLVLHVAATLQGRVRRTLELHLRKDSRSTRVIGVRH